MDVELLFRRTLVYTLATAAIIGICLLAVNLFELALAGGEEPHVTLIAILCTVLVMLLFTPVKTRVQDGIDRLFFGERYSSRKALLRLSQDLNADLDLDRLAERLLEGVRRALGVSSMAVFLPEGETATSWSSSRWAGRTDRATPGCPRDGVLVRPAGRGRAGERGGPAPRRRPRRAPSTSATTSPAGPRAS